MRNFFIYLFIIVLSMGLVVNEAAAKRFGGGRSFGVQRSSNSMMSSYKQPYQNKAAPLGQNANKSRWGGMLGGLLIGGLLGSLFMGHGFASGLLSWIVLGAIALFIFNFIRRRTQQPSMQSANSNPFSSTLNNFTQQFNQPNAGFGAGAGSAAASEYPVDFDAENFLREAKVCFIRLQTAYDQKNLHDLTAFTAPEVFGEIKMQLDERGDAPNKTEVLDLNAELLDVSKQFDSSIASVRFTGNIKENDDPVTPLNEIWHFRRFGDSKDWVVGGIQQET